MQEIWKDVSGYEGKYKVSNLGNVKSLGRTVIRPRQGNYFNKERMLKISINKYGYASCALCKNSKLKTYKIHRLIAIAFIPNPENKRTINHIDGIKTNNCIDNLEWATHSENNKHAFATGLKKPNMPMLGRAGANSPINKKIYQYTMNNIFIRSYFSVTEAARINGLCTGDISRAANKKRNMTQCGNFVWSYTKH